MVRVRSGKSVDYDLHDLGSDKAVRMACGALETAVKAGFCKKRLRKAVHSHEISADTRAALLEALLVSGPKIQGAERKELQRQVQVLLEAEASQDRHHYSTRGRRSVVERPACRGAETRGG